MSWEIKTIGCVYLLINQWKKLITKARAAAEIINAQKVEKRITGTIKPAKENPEKVNSEIDTFGTKTVRM